MKSRLHLNLHHRVLASITETTGICRFKNLGVVSCHDYSFKRMPVLLRTRPGGIRSVPRLFVKLAGYRNIFTLILNHIHFYFCFALAAVSCRRLINLRVRRSGLRTTGRGYTNILPRCSVLTRRIPSAALAAGAFRTTIAAIAAVTAGFVEKAPAARASLG